MTSPLFVVGCPRSGTTLLAEMLARTSFGKPTETHFITKYRKRLERYGDIAERSAFLALAGDILRERPVLQWRLDTTPERLWESCERHDYRTLIERIMMTRSATRGYAGWGDKTPHYLLDLEILDGLFPDARFLYVVRDGRDVTLSLLGRSWGPNNVYRCAVYWKEYNRPRRVLDALEQSGRLLRLRYEDLLDHPRRLHDEVYGFLGQPQDARLRDGFAESVRGGNHGKWKSRMRPGEIRLFESVAAETLRRFGYETSHSEAPVPAPTRWLWTLHDALLRNKELLRQNTVEWVRIRYFGKEPFAD